MRLFKYISSQNEILKKEYASNHLEIIFQGVLLTFISRILSSKTKTKDFKGYVKQLTAWNLFPVKHIKSKKDYIINFILKYYYFLPFYQFVYQRIIIPYILPKINRTTGRLL